MLCRHSTDGIVFVCHRMPSMIYTEKACPHVPHSRLGPPYGTVPAAAILLTNSSQAALHARPRRGVRAADAAFALK